MEVEGDCCCGHVEITGLLYGGERTPFNVHDIEKRFQIEYVRAVCARINAESGNDD